jgi:hypothetical protein
MHITLSIQKIMEHAEDETASVNHMDEDAAIKGFGIAFNEDGHRMFLDYGDTWKRVNKFLDLPPQVDITGPSCLDGLTLESGSRVLTSRECCAGVCGGCTIKQFVADRGVMVCCICRHSIGTPMPSSSLQHSSEDMIWSVLRL